MSSRPLFKPHKVVTNGSMAADIVSEVTIIQMLSLVSYSISWVGASPVGTISVEVSDDYAQDAAGIVKNPGNWSTLPLSTTASVAGNADSGVIDIQQIPAYAIRLRFTRASGTGTMQATVSGKVA